MTDTYWTNDRQIIQNDDSAAGFSVIATAISNEIAEDIVRRLNAQERS